MSTPVEVSINNENAVLTMTGVNNPNFFTIEYGTPKMVDSVTADGSSMTSYDMLVTPNNGFLIDSAKIPDGGGGYATFTVSADGTQATINSYNGLYGMSSMQVEIVTLVDQPPQDVSGFNHLYLVNKSILGKVSSERFLTGDVDLGKYMINVLELPFPLNADVLGLETQIRLGTYLLETKAIELKNDELSLDLGSIIIPSKFNNSYDYLNTNTYLHLPFSQTIELDVSYSVSQTIEILYIVNLYTGETTINITSTKLNGEIVYNENLKIGKNIPYIVKGGEIIGEQSKNNGLNNQVFTAFIEVIRNKPYESNNPFNDDTMIQTKLINETGFMRVNNVILNTEASLQEKNNIVSLLKSGVFVK